MLGRTVGREVHKHAAIVRRCSCACCDEQWTTSWDDLNGEDAGGLGPTMSCYDQKSVQTVTKLLQGQRAAACMEEAP